jgi:hypothetical protein
MTARGKIAKERCVAGSRSLALPERATSDRCSLFLWPDVDIWRRRWQLATRRRPRVICIRMCIINLSLFSFLIFYFLFFGTRLISRYPAALGDVNDPPGILEMCVFLFSARPALSLRRCFFFFQLLVPLAQFNIPGYYRIAKRYIQAWWKELAPDASRRVERDNLSRRISKRVPNRYIS